MQLQTFRAVTLVTEVHTASSDVDNLLVLEPKIIGGEIDETKISVRKLDKALQYEK